MRKYILLLIVAAATAKVGSAQRLVPNHPEGDTGPGVPIIKVFLEAYNKQDVLTIRKMISKDLVFLDDDGHTNIGAQYAEAFMLSRLSTPTAEKLVASGPITSNGTADIVWASFPYVFDRGAIHRTGLITMIFRKSGADWQIVHVQFGIDQVRANPPR